MLSQVGGKASRAGFKKSVAVMLTLKVSFSPMAFSRAATFLVRSSIQFAFYVQNSLYAKGWPIIARTLYSLTFLPARASRADTSPET